MSLFKSLPRGRGAGELPVLSGLQAESRASAEAVHVGRGGRMIWKTRPARMAVVFPEGWGACRGPRGSHLSDWSSSQLKCGQASRSRQALTGKVTLCGRGPTSPCIFTTISRL